MNKLTEIEFKAVILDIIENLKLNEARHDKNGTCYGCCRIDDPLDDLSDILEEHGVIEKLGIYIYDYQRSEGDD